MIYGASPYGSSSIGGMTDLSGEEISRHIQVMYRNILESSTVTVTSENTSYPAYRLYDRDIDRLFKGNSSPATFDILIDQGTSLYEVNTLIIPTGHNLTDLILRLYYSDDNATFYQASAWYGVSGQMDREVSLTGARYWKLRIYNPSSPPEIPELFLTQSYEFEHNIRWGFAKRDRFNINRREVLSGRLVQIKNGVARREREYSILRMPSSQKDEFEIWQSITEGMKGFYVRDDSSALFFTELLEPMRFTGDFENMWNCELKLLEII
jgi:hypothetical protein